MIYMKIFAVDWDHLDAADKPRHVGGGQAAARRRRTSRGT